MKNYKIIYSCGTEIIKYVDSDSLNNASEQAKKPLMFPIEFPNYEDMEIWISESEDPDNILEHFYYSEI